MKLSEWWLTTRKADLEGCSQNHVCRPACTANLPTRVGVRNVQSDEVDTIRQCLRLHPDVKLLRGPFDDRGMRQ